MQIPSIIQTVAP